MDMDRESIKGAKMVAYGVFAAWSAASQDSPLSLDRHEYEALLEGDLIARSQEDIGWEFLKKLFKAAEPAMGMLVFPADIVRRYAKRIQSATGRLMPDLMGELKAKAAKVATATSP